MSDEASDLERLVTAVQASSSCRMMCTDAIRNVGARELANRSSLREAIKGAKNKLHQIAGAYQEREPSYDTWASDLQAARQSGDRSQFLAACRRIMACHSSTCERLPILDQFYATTLAGCGAIRSVLDLACGLNPLAIPWMPLAADVTYHACDIYRDMMAFLDACLRILGVSGDAQACDVLQTLPTQRVDVALLLKIIPCLEQVDKLAGLRLLDNVNARFLLVSFPVRSLGGRSKGMPSHYEAHFRDLAAQRTWAVQRFVFDTELAFLVEKS